MLVHSFLICFWQFYFLTQTDDFAKAIAFAWKPFLPIFEMVSFPKYLVFFRAVFCKTKKKYDVFVDSFSVCLGHFSF